MDELQLEKRADVRFGFKDDTSASRGDLAKRQDRDIDLPLFRYS